MSESTGSSETRPTIKRADTIKQNTVDAGEGFLKSVLIGPEDGAPNLSIRRFELEPGASVPKHTNEIEHEQYVLEGEYTVGFDGEEHTVAAGDSILIPAGTVHWYRNDGDESGTFLCAVPNGDDTIEVLE